MLLANRLPRLLLAFIYAIAIAAGVGEEHNIAGSLAVCIIHIVFRIAPDNCFCLNDKPYFAAQLEEDVYDAAALIFASTGCTFSILQHAVTDSGVSVALFSSIAVTLSFAIGKSKPIKTQHVSIDMDDLLEDGKADTE